MGRVGAGLHLAMIVAIWLVAWIPMAAYGLLAFATAHSGGQTPHRSAKVSRRRRGRS